MILKIKEFYIIIETIIYFILFKDQSQYII